MPKVSIIVPNYNHGQFLEQRLDSILNQTYQDFEVIYLDDASTDNSSDVFVKYATHSKIQSLFNETNSGSPFKQWNRGIGLAQGEYIWIAESDDYADPKFLEKLVEVLDRNPSVGIVYSQSWEVNAGSSILSTRHYWTDDLNLERWKQDFISSGIVECQKYLILKNTIPNASAVLFRASLYRESRIENNHFRLAGDWLAWAKMLIFTDLAYLNEPLNYYRMHDRTARKSTVNKLSSIEERLEVIRFISENVNLSRQEMSQVFRILMNRLFNNWADEGRMTSTHLSILKKIFEIARYQKLEAEFFTQLSAVVKNQAIFRTKSLFKSKLPKELIANNG